ncbi:hypothetical protein LWC34_51120 [Kibdelosporangium philippinense]|uniref:Uncharacterized protein n=1 Tax=Kibdelosporangium philippinense TaxID=211113 RepID=A0ABS8ZTP7_9PSEU|nr:hypothetical protein [Kibdelosporangium philippinense]MCE7011104.1 hypothetical protein [Kibdelosporangium philippinense]
MRLVLVCLLVMAVAGCGPETSAFTRIDLTGQPVLLTPAGDDLLVGVRRDGQPVVPGLMRIARDGTVTEIPIRAESPYGMLAKWYAIDSDGTQILAVGGERGGAHANVRWSVWTGTTAGITERVQGFSTFGGWGAGELVGAAVSASGPLVVGSWQSAKAGLDIAVWTTDGETWTRQDSGGSVVESNRDTLGFANSAVPYKQGILVAGMVLTGGRQIAAVWQSTNGNTGWTVTPLPDAGTIAVASGIRCWGAVCGVAGTDDGKLALWRLTSGVWTRVPGTPPIPVKDSDKPAAPVDENMTQVLSENGQVKIVRADGGKWTVDEVPGPSGTVTSAAKVAGKLYILAGDQLWRE